jgi:hypothetical protein
MLETKFWRRAAASLPRDVRTRYALELGHAERLDRALGRAVRAYRRGKAALKLKIER